VVLPLLAKSTSTPTAPQGWCTLRGHTERALDAAEAILDESLDAALASFGLPGEPWLKRCRAAVLLGIFAHDLGKANDHFQAMVRGDREVRQGHRHELLSFWLLSDRGPLHEWALGAVEPIIAAAVLCAVVGHHLKFENAKALDFAYKATATRVTFLGTHPDLAPVLELASGRLDLGPAPPLKNTSFDAHDADLEAYCLPAVLSLRSTLRDAHRDERLFIAMVRSMVVAADVAASMLARRPDADPARWVRSTLRTTPEAGELRRIVDRRLGGCPVRPFQAAVAATAATVTLVRAGCGTGKTVAAYLWAAARAPGRKLFVCYPTTGTATEGFADYVLAADVAAELVHSRARVDLELIAPADLLVNGAEGPNETARQWADTGAALPLWGSGIAVATADAVLGLLQNYRAALFAFPALAIGAFVFDEIHQYDRRTFATLCRFIEEARATPFLLMTASLPEARRRDLEQAARVRGQSLQVIDGPIELERGARYDIEIGDEAMAADRARGMLSEGRKVLWVCNTVREAVAAAEQMSGATPPPLVYHSRFRYQDRAERLRQVVNSFGSPGPAFAVTTQVCEVSLDLSADLLVSHVAPVPAMIQRLGRLNRRFDPAHPSQRSALFVEPDSARPYAPDELARGREWLSQVAGSGRSQRDLSAAFEALSQSAVPISPVVSAWLDEAPFAWPAPLREIDPALQVILPSDARACRRRGRVLLNQVARWAIPMPLKPVAQEFQSWDRLAMAFVAPEGRVSYSSQTGASWTP
jgi:CRISPR-associated endonuclease/helicase Cas3